MADAPYDSYKNWIESLLVFGSNERRIGHLRNQIMAELKFQNTTESNPSKIKQTLGQFGIAYERWGNRHSSANTDSEILVLYEQEISQLKTSANYVTADLVALRPETPNLATICEKFVKEHHHNEDEVRFCVEGEGVFELFPENAEPLVFKAEPGDLIVVPAKYRHLFYLTETKMIRCIRLFKTQDGWEALYEKEA